MKKILLAIVLVMTMCFGASAQFDGFITEGSDGGYRDGGADMPMLPQGSVGGNDNDQPAAPLGSGLLILTALGGAYLLRKKE